MEFSQNTRVSSDFQKTFQGASQHIFTTVVLIDKRDVDSQGKVYQLSPEFLVNPENLRPLKQRFLMGHYEGVFLPMGNLDHLDRSKKQLRLKSGNVVSYGHLIQLMGTNQDESEFIGALEALIDALLVSNRQSVIHALQKLSVPHKKNVKYDPHVSSIKRGRPAVNPKTYANDALKETELPLDKRFYELQL